MILVDASVWIDHVRAPDDVMTELLLSERVLTHPFIIGEVVLGHVRRREAVLSELRELPLVGVVDDDEVLEFIHTHRLFGLGIGYIDAHLLASSKLAEGSSIWTLDRNLRAAAAKLGLAADGP
ncbi:MAG TPA: type II toxin-antitoxin system VapC family toxin [Rhizomicrobium sp.]|nr:type II toxin-antitoxin system VapC family toxin [Rhizomicrobium sp.]